MRYCKTTLKMKGFINPRLLVKILLSVFFTYLFFYGILYLKFSMDITLDIQVSTGTVQFNMSNNNYIRDNHAKRNNFTENNRKYEASNEWNIHYNQSRQTSIKMLPNKVFKILYWTDSFQKGGSWFGLGSAPFRHCPYSNCMTTRDRGELSASDAVLFFMIYTQLEDLPQPTDRQGAQKWILFNMECPARAELYSGYDHRSYNGLTYNGIFNATMTYHIDADIPYTYTHMRGRQFVKREHTDGTSVNYAAGKSKLVAWFVSNCGQWRDKYVEKLQKHVKVDVYGKCGPLECERKLPYSQMINDSCNKILETDYKFYLSFESHLCEHYYTEKLWKPLLFRTVPIVMGMTDYSNVLPPHSYIDIKDFRSPQDLADYLIILDTNDDLYNSYFSWRRDYELRTYPEKQCFICEHLNLYDGTVSVHEDMDAYWREDINCVSPQVYYTGVYPETWT